MSVFMDFRNLPIDVEVRGKTLTVVLRFEMKGFSMDNAREWCSKWSADAVAADFWFDFNSWGYEIKKSEWKNFTELHMTAVENINAKNKTTVPEIILELEEMGLDDGVYEGGDDNNFWVIPDSFFEDED